ncbi:hypothetical protein OXYTRIMIC_104 [Oxytricha trifallax]|uniref:Uncharacterized protein n=1 Tax=Oxytricha trifallax TaxID=1172189 RepID=A0A073HXB1_9SPIT|nr:hypothetical protein OXYTRIMIC_104 [Oxytricha trifallax]
MVSPPTAPALMMKSEDKVAKIFSLYQQIMTKQSLPPFDNMMGCAGCYNLVVSERQDSKELVCEPAP